MNKRLCYIVFCLFVTPTVFGHRLNEYLQATTIRLSKDSVFLELRLTPGTDIAPAILSMIDANGDGVLETSEQSNYLQQVTHDLTLTLDGRVLSLQPASAYFGSTNELRKGIGDIVINYHIPLTGPGASHVLQLDNRHYAATAVYLVNCLAPDDPHIQVTTQTRNAGQSAYELNFTTDAPAAATAPAHQALSTDLQQEDQRSTGLAFFYHGMRHILTGYDHLLFLAALVLGAMSLWELVKVVTAFTIAHSVTLTLAALHLVHVPAAIVEPVIAGSIVFVAMQNIFRPGQASGNGRLIIAFVFGLFHGLGFAGGLLDLLHAMPRETMLWALFGFTLGIEAGNQLVLLPLFGITRLLRAPHKRPASTTNTQPGPLFLTMASAVIGVAGVVYLVLAVIEA